MEDVLILIGFMGVGKTASGRELARRLGWDFVDLDQAVEESAGLSIPVIFAQRGEECFRRLESEALEQTLQRGRVVIATGGGVVLGEKNRKLLAGSRVFYLYAPAQECLRRLRKSSTPRPLLAGPNPEQRVFSIFAEREPLYETLGERVDTRGLTTAEVATAILERLRADSVAATG